MRLWLVAVAVMWSAPVAIEPMRCDYHTEVRSTRVVDRRMVASYYHQSLHLGLTASGLRYDSRQLTAAHQDLPFGTRLRLYANGRTVDVTITDRGPFIAGRHIDLSRAAARRLGMIKQGVIEVSYEVL